MKSINYYRKFKDLMLPPFEGKTVLPTAKMRQNRKNVENFDLRTNSEYLRKCFFKRVVSLWNTLPENIKNKKMQLWNSQEENKKFSSERFLFEVYKPEYGKRCWSEFRFNYFIPLISFINPYINLQIVLKKFYTSFFSWTNVMPYVLFDWRNSVFF